MTQTFTNPVVRGLNPDPSICRAGSDYYLATSTMHLYPGVPIHHSRDLVHWRLLGHCLTRPEQFLADRTTAPPMIYAPTLRYHDGTFYMVTTNVHGGGNFYVTASDPAGPWSDPIVIDADVFDPSLFFDNDGKAYYTRRGDMRDKDVVQAEIDIRTGKLLTPLRSIGTGMVSDDAEGPHLYHIGDWYYLLQAEGGSRFLHMATISRGKSPWGPFEPCPHNPIVAQHEAWWHPIRSIGHVDLIEAHDGSWWAVFLGTRHASYDALTVIGRETFLAPVRWVDGWPVVEKTAMREFTVTAPVLPSHPWEPLPALDDFDAPGLRLEWTMLAIPTAGLYSLTERPGYLRLHGSATPPIEGQPCAFVGVRQRDLRFRAAACLEFSPASANEEAGIVIFQRGNYRYDLCLTERSGQRVALLTKRVGDIVHEAAIVPVPEGPVELRVDGDENQYHFFVRPAGGEWQVVGTALTQLITAEVAGTWGGVLIGLYGTGNGSACASPADFDWFEYRGMEQPENG